MPNRFTQPTWGYQITKLLLRIYLRLFHDFKVMGAENIPAAGPVIIAANHSSLWDPPVLGAAIPWHQTIHFMAKEELFKNVFFRKIIQSLHAFPVRRGMADREAIRNALYRLNNNNLMGIFPQGTRHKQGDEQWQGEAGMALLALKTGATIVPTAIIGTDKGWNSPFRVEFGQPITVERQTAGKEQIEGLTKKIMAQIQLQVQAGEGR